MLHHQGPDHLKKASLQYPFDSGLACLRIVAAYHQLELSEKDELFQIGIVDRCAEYTDLIRIALRHRMRARLTQVSTSERLSNLPLPAIARLSSGEFVILSRTSNATLFRLVSPGTRSERTMAPSEILDAIQLDVLLITRRFNAFQLSQREFGLAWFAHSVWRYRRPIAHILIASFFIQVLALMAPLFFQVAIDKVIVHKGYSTLVVLIFGLVVIGLVDVVLQYLRSYALAHTSNRIDIELAGKLFHHLLRLPISYFESRSAGQTVARMRELENIRQFLTGPALFAGLDLFFVLVFLIILMIYSWKLGLVVFISIPVYLVIAFIVKDPLVELIKEKFNRGALSQNFLVETIIGILTIKSTAVEPLAQKKWEDRLASYVKTDFSVSQVASVGRTAIQYVNKLVAAIILFLGSMAVMDGALTIGEFVAFNMISSQISQPVLRMAQLWQDFQQVQISIARIGDIMNTPPEFRPSSLSGMAEPRGAIRFENVNFSYVPNGDNVIKSLNLKIAPGEVIGIVGPSGSGKSTIAKLIQRLYLPQQGQIFFDDVDVSTVAPDWLRKKISVVLQESMIFNGTVHENIAFTNPILPREHVISCAKISGADEFIAKLPQGYATELEERGANLSGGQKQRIAIARALACNPKVLIFDEATSALDFESELIFQSNMNLISRGRTVIVISHRLASLKNCSRIITIENGCLVEEGAPSELMKNTNSFYYKLCKAQLPLEGVL